MLTKNDLSQIRNLMTETIKKETPGIVSPIVQGEIQIALKPVKRKLNQISKDLSYVIKTYDARIVENSREIDKVKKHIGMDIN